MFSKANSLASTRFITSCDECVHPPFLVKAHKESPIQCSQRSAILIQVITMRVTKCKKANFYMHTGARSLNKVSFKVETFQTCSQA